jgi:hypothetical protein
LDIAFDLAKVNDGVLYMLGGSTFKVCRAGKGVKAEVRLEIPEFDIGQPRLDSSGDLVTKILFPACGWGRCDLTLVTVGGAKGRGI